jgi:hypothetical protein
MNQTALQASWPTSFWCSILTPFYLSVLRINASACFCSCSYKNPIAGTICRCSQTSSGSSISVFLCLMGLLKCWEGGEYALCSCGLGSGPQLCIKESRLCLLLHFHNFFLNRINVFHFRSNMRIIKRVAKKSNNVQLRFGA